MTIGENIRRLRREAGLSQEELAEIAQVTNKAVSSWEIGGRTPRLGALRRIATHFHISVTDLLSLDDHDSGETVSKPHLPIPHAAEAAPYSKPQPSFPIYTNWIGEAPAYPSAEKLSPAAQLQLINAYITADAATRSLVCRALGIAPIPLQTPAPPDAAPIELIVYDTPAAAGLPLYVESSYERHTFPPSTVPTGADFGVRIFGDSMEPTLTSGCIAFVRKQDQLPTGEIGIFTLDGEAVCKRYSQPHPSSRPLLLSDNPNYAPIDLEPNDVRVLGVVLGAYHP